MMMNILLRAYFRQRAMYPTRKPRDAWQWAIVEAKMESSTGKGWFK